MTNKELDAEIKKTLQIINTAKSKMLIRDQTKYLRRLQKQKLKKSPH